MNAATVLKLKGGGVFTTTANKSLLEIAKLLAQHGFGIREAQARDLWPGPNAPVARQSGRTGREIVLE